MDSKVTSKTLADIIGNDAAPVPVLSFAQSDIEKRISFPAGRFTSPGPLLAPITAAGLSAGLYAVMSLFRGAFVAEMFCGRGAVPYVIVFLSFWSCSILLIKMKKLSLQKKTLKLNFLPTDDPGFVLSPASSEHVLQRLFGSVDDPQNFILTRRIQNALANLKNIGRIGDVDTVLGTQADNDEGMIESSYTVLKGFIRSIPVLGFIGTVWGLSVALGSFGGVLTSAQEMSQLRTALQGVTGGLSTAFETTLLGLVSALSIHLFMVAIRRKEEQFLDDCKDYCQKYVIGKLRLTGLQG